MICLKTPHTNEIQSKLNVSQIKCQSNRHHTHTVIVFTVLPPQWMRCEDGERQSNWPPYRSSAQIILAVRSGEIPRNSWNSDRIRLLQHTCENRDLTCA